MKPTEVTQVEKYLEREQIIKNYNTNGNFNHKLNKDKANENNI